MAKKLRILFIAIVALVGAGFYAYRNYYPAIRPVINPPPEDIVKLIEEGNKFPAEVPKEGEIPPKLQIPANTTGMSLKLPQGFSISIFAKDLPGARVMAFDSFGNMWVSQTSRGIISLLEVKDGKTIVQNDIFTGLRKPHGLAFDPQSPTMLYYAEEDKISRVVVYSDGEPEKIPDLPGNFRADLPILQIYFNQSIFRSTSQLHVAPLGIFIICYIIAQRRCYNSLETAPIA